MNLHLMRALFLAMALAVAAACGTQRSTDDQNARDSSATTSPAAPAAEPATPPAPQGTSGSHGVADAERGQTAQREAAQSAKQQAAEEQVRQEAAAREAVAKQKALNEEQAATNARLQEEVNRLKPREITLPAGTVIPVRTTTELSTSTLANGATFDAVLEKDVAAGDTIVAKAGTRVTGVVVSADKGGKVKGTASLAVGLRSIVGVKSTVIPVQTDSFSSEAASSKKKDAVRTGVATGIGAAVGAIAGGGKGAAIGAGAGAAAGVGTNMATRGEAAVIPAEQLIEFHLTAPATFTMQP